MRLQGRTGSHYLQLSRIRETHAHTAAEPMNYKPAATDREERGGLGKAGFPPKAIPKGVAFGSCHNWLTIAAVGLKEGAKKLEGRGFEGSFGNDFIGHGFGLRSNISISASSAFLTQPFGWLDCRDGR